MKETENMTEESGQIKSKGNYETTDENMKREILTIKIIKTRRKNEKKNNHSKS